MQIENSRRTLRAQALSIIRDELISGRLRPGQKLNEVQIAAEIGISRGTLREAIRNLEQEGLLVSIPHRGTYVRRFTARQAAELQEVRLSLEVTAACSVARSWRPEIRAFLDQRLSALEVAYRMPLPFPDRLRADLGFHEAICESCGNETLLDVWRSLIGHITVMVLNVGEARMTPLQDPDAHRPLVEAIEAGDEESIREVFAEHFAAGQVIVSSAVGDTEADEISAVELQRG
jgi:DNA-binding GntR family transcriptional regulator